MTSDEISEAVQAAGALEGEFHEWLEAKDLDADELFMVAEGSAKASVLAGDQSTAAVRNVVLGFVIGYTLAERRWEP